MKSIRTYKAKLFSVCEEVYPYKVHIDTDPLDLSDVIEMQTWLKGLGNPGSQFAPRNPMKDFYYPLTARWDRISICNYYFREENDAAIFKLFWSR